MIAQIWRGVTRADDRKACVAHLLAAIHSAVADCTACEGAYLLSRPVGDAEVELMVLTLFGQTTVSRCHDGETLYRAAVFDRPLPLVLDSSIAVYEVSTDSRRTLSYANLRRRFPLRLMVPR